MDRRSRLILLYVGLLSASMGNGMARPATAYYVKYGLGGSMLAAAGLTTGFMAGRALASMITGLLSEAAPRFRWLIVAASLLAAGLILYAGIPSSHTASTVVLLMGVWGILSGFAWPSVQVVASGLGGVRSGTAMALYFAVGGLGISIGNWFFGHTSLPYAGQIRAAGLLYLAAAVILSYSTRTPVGLRRASMKAAVKRVVNPLILWVILSAFALGFLSGTLSEYFYVYVHESYGLSKADLGNLLLLAGLVSVLGGLMAGSISDRKGATRTLYFVLMVAAASSLALGLPLSSVILISLSYILARASVRSSMPLTRNAAIAGEVGGSLMVGTSNMASSIGMMTGPLVAGALYEISPRYGGLPFTASGVLIITMLVLYKIISIRGVGPTSY